MTEKYKKLKHLIPNDCLIGPLDYLPGLKMNHLPLSYDAFQEGQNISHRDVLYVHNFKISSLDYLERAFHSYLKKMCLSQSEMGANSQGNLIQYEILERKMTVIPHNSWKQIGSEVQIAIVEQRNGQFAPETGKLIQFTEHFFHRMVALVFKFAYRVQFLSQTDKNYNRAQEFVIANAVYMPKITTLGELQEDEVKLEMKMGPGVSITGDVLWD